eukprot:GHVP01000027.1.p1 GENE.GHVP01000027.1~~GHVP01000027.1.p1  ORF type:complete len:337 (-),score=60.34 GHVP01000027.1:108-1073(-)
MKSIFCLLLLGLSSATKTKVVRTYTGSDDSNPMIGLPQVLSKECEFNPEWGSPVGEGGVGIFTDPLYAVLSGVGGSDFGTHGSCGHMYAIEAKEGDSYVYFKIAAYQLSRSEDLEIGAISCQSVDENGRCENTVAFMLPELSNTQTYVAAQVPSVDGNADVVTCSDFSETNWAEVGSGDNMENAKNAIISGTVDFDSFCGMTYIFADKYYQIKGRYEDEYEFGTIIIDTDSCDDVCEAACSENVCGVRTFPMFGGEPAPTTEPSEEETTTEEKESTTEEKESTTEEITTTTISTTKEVETTIEEDSSAFAVIAVSVLTIFV